MVKNYLQNILKIVVDDNHFHNTHRIGQKYRGDNGKECQQVIVIFKGFIPKTKVYRARKHKSDIFIQLDLIKKRYDLLRETCTGIKGVDRVEICEHKLFSGPLFEK